MKSIIEQEQSSTFTTYAVCPRCMCVIEREYVPFCSECGQKLNWNSYEHATLLLPR